MHTDPMKCYRTFTLQQDHNIVESGSSVKKLVAFELEHGDLYFA